LKEFVTQAVCRFYQVVAGRARAGDLPAQEKPLLSLGTFGWRLTASRIPPGERQAGGITERGTDYPASATGYRQCRHSPSSHATDAIGITPYPAHQPRLGASPHSSSLLRCCSTENMGAGPPHGQSMDQSALLDDLDRRQNEVLDRLAELNARVEALLQECMTARENAAEANCEITKSKTQNSKTETKLKSDKRNK
jgi:hypothetical protein